jgi:hypothetical protein
MWTSARRCGRRAGRARSGSRLDRHRRCPSMTRCRTHQRHHLVTLRHGRSFRPEPGHRLLCADGAGGATHAFRYARLDGGCQRGEMQIGREAAAPSAVSCAVTSIPVTPVWIGRRAALAGCRVWTPASRRYGPSSNASRPARTACAGQASAARGDQPPPPGASRRLLVGNNGWPAPPSRHRSPSG